MIQRTYLDLQPVTAILADYDVSQRNAVRLFAENQEQVALCGTMATGREVLSALHDGPCPEVLVLDVLLRDMNLYDLLEQIGRMNLKRRPAIILTAMQANLQQQSRLLAAGVDYIMYKPYELQVLFSTIVNFGVDLAAFEKRRTARQVEEVLYDMRADFSSKGVEYICRIEQLLVPEGALVSANEAYQTVADEVNAASRRRGRGKGTAKEKELGAEGISTAVRRAIQQMGERQTDIFREMCAYSGKSSLSNAEFLNLLALKIRQALRG